MEDNFFSYKASIIQNILVREFSIIILKIKKGGQTWVHVNIVF